MALKLAQEAKKRLRNRAIKSAVKVYISQARESIEHKEPELTPKKVLQAIRALDKAVAKGVIHPNSAARSKSRLVKKLRQVFPEPEA